MWVITTEGMISCVRHKDKPNIIIVRARKKDHLERAFPQHADAIFQLEDADYTWRLHVEEQVLKDMLVRYVEEKLDYPNFKNAVAERHPEERAYLDALHEVWFTFLRFLKYGGRS
ncbi:hypothetical protein [Thermopetrobacter sp. TC1]|uniref:hypothetical protein n=1 Tax=Thermopetrobacter sp. TC1 TaxID=1495045 RepID=UPI0006895A30|nr:hypothetical protein [Thermopetrobacter sp. TC1]